MKRVRDAEYPFERPESLYQSGPHIRLRKICISWHRERDLDNQIWSDSHKMPIQDHYQLPPSAQELPIANDPAGKLFVCFISSTDPSTKQPWCPDVRAALPRLEKAFSSQDAPRLAYVHVGQKPECVFFPYDCGLWLRARAILTGIRWKEMNNICRKAWGICALPTLVRYQRIDGAVTATGRLVEGEIMDDKKLFGLCNE